MESEMLQKTRLENERIARRNNAIHAADNCYKISYRVDKDNFSAETYIVAHTQENAVAYLTTLARKVFGRDALGNYKNPAIESVEYICRVDGIDKNLITKYSEEDKKW